MLNRLKFTLRSTVIYSIGSIGTKLIGLILLPVYTGKLTPAQYGMWSLLEVTSQLLVMIVGLRLSTAVIRFYSSSDDKDYKGKVLFLAFSVSLASILFFNAVSQPFTEKYSLLFFDTGEYALYFRYLFVWISFEVMNILILGFIRVKEKPLLYILGTTAKFTTVLLLIIYLVARKDMGIQGIILGQLAGSILMFLAFIPLLIREMKWSFDRGLFLELVRYSIPLIFSGAATFLLSFGDRYLIKMFLDYREVGLYSLSFKISNVLKIVFVQSFQLGFLPIAFSMFGKPDSKRFFSKVFTYYVFVLLWASLSVSLFAKEIIELFSTSTEYYEAYLFVPMLTLAIVFFALQNFFILGMHYAKKTSHIALITTSVLFFNIGMNILLIPVMKLYGVALTYIVTGLVMMLVNYYFSQKFYYIPFEKKRVMIIFLLALSLYLVSMLLNNAPLIFSVILKILLLAAYPVIFYILGFYDPVEIERLKGFWHKWKDPSKWYSNFFRDKESFF